MGFKENSQYYIVDMYKYAVSDSWSISKVIPQSQSQTFSHFVSFEYIYISEKNVTNSSYIDIEKLFVPLDIFYPFYIHSCSLINA